MTVNGSPGQCQTWAEELLGQFGILRQEKKEERKRKERGKKEERKSQHSVNTE